MNIEHGSVNTLEVYHLLSISSYIVCHFKAFDDYITLHNLSTCMLLKYIVTLYHNNIMQ